SARINASLPSGTPLDLVHLPANGENQIIYYLQQSLRRYDHLKDFDQAVQTDAAQRYVLAPVLVREHLAQQGDVEELATGPIPLRQPAEEQLVLYKLTCRPAVARAPDAQPR